VFSLRTIEDMDRICLYVDTHRPRRVAVVGAGFIGLEAAEVFVHRGLAVELIELADQVLPPLDADMAKYVENELRDAGVSLHLGQAMEGLECDGDQARAVVLSGGARVPADAVLLSIGVRPNTKLAREAGLELGDRGGIKVNELLQTSDPTILAAGDAVEIVHTVTGRPTLIPLAGPANKLGRLAGEVAATDAGPPAATAAGTAIVKVFGVNVAMTGMSIKAAQRENLAADHVMVRRGHHVGYYPGSEAMNIKLIFDPQDRRILGGQIVGGAGVDRRIDVIATALHFKGTVDDLAALDLAYAPQFGAAKDPVHIAAFVAHNQARGLVKHVHVQDMATCLEANYQLVDVRTPTEYEKGSIPGAVNVELDRIRERLPELEPQRPVLLFCQVGQRGYVAARILMSRGFSEVYNLAGGYHAYAAHEATS
jgi:NADPH-dependent 2,4-dienoyl-CoA reductase/sulfur reductase-like enzyme/rhodanese-related sulfurtransferase